MKVLPLLAFPLLAALAGGCGGPGSTPNPLVLRIGHFPNVTHAHGLVAHHRSATGANWLEARLGDGVRVEWYVFNAGPSAMEAMRAGSLDATYVGPSPALNSYVKSKGDEVRVLAGATRGGSALVVAGAGPLRTAADFRGRRVATPQVGNTQDVACRTWLAAAGLRATIGGGDVRVDGVANPDQLTLLRRGEIDAAWTVEPWVSRLETEAGGRVLVEEPDAVTTVLVGSARLVRERPALARALVAAHRELTAWLRANPDAARAEVRAALEEETKAKLSDDVLRRAFGRMRFDDAISRADFDAFVRAAQGVGFLADAIPLDGLVVAP